MIKNHLYTNQKLLFKIKNLSKDFQRPIKIWSRNTTINEDYLDKNFLVHNGNKFILIKITEDMLGQKFGEFVNTRKLCVFKKTYQKKTKSK